MDQYGFYAKYLAGQIEESNNYSSGNHYDFYLCRENDCKFSAAYISNLQLGGLFPLDDSAALRQRKVIDNYYKKLSEDAINRAKRESSLAVAGIMNNEAICITVCLAVIALVLYWLFF